MRTTLVIVESPAKCKKIESYLGPGYKCIASFGHVREVKSLDAIHREKQYAIDYEMVADTKKQKYLALIKREIAQAEEVILATDDDREGEAIAWHICCLFDLPVDTTKRIVFHEITEDAIQRAILYPRHLDKRKIHAQQARQVLDLVVGFQVSPVLWKHITNSSTSPLSAGRCQTPALRLVYENQQEIDQSPGISVYHTIGYFTSKCIVFELNHVFSEESHIRDFLQQSIGFSPTFQRSEIKKVLREPPEPLTTSRIQQLASNEMRISPKETMKICQTLYEAGYITYMRTDSKKYSPDFLTSVKTYVERNYGNVKYIHPNIDTLAVGYLPMSIEEKKKTNTNSTNINSKKKSSKKIAPKSAPPPQEAHEAIRPTQLSLMELPSEMSAREKKMYRLIWETSLESCMAPAEFYTFVASASTYHPEWLYKTTQECIDFPGWKMVKQKFSKVNKEFSYLQQLKIGGNVPCSKIVSKVSLQGTVSHYTEAKLVQLLEEQGIGRPSTFSMLVDKIQERGYVTKQDIPGKKIQSKQFALENSAITETWEEREFGAEKGKLVIQPLGVFVIQFLIQHFDSLFNYQYTKDMEDHLDKIAHGEKEPWFEICEITWRQVASICDALKKEKKREIQIDADHIFTIGKYGPVIKCTRPSEGEGDNKCVKKATFLSVRKDLDIGKVERGEYSLEEIVEDKKESGQEPLGEYQGHPLFIKRGKYGRYAAWGSQKKSLAAFGNRPTENLLLEDVVAEIEKHGVPVDGETKVSPIVRIVSDNISIRRGKYGEYIFYKTAKMKKPKFLKLDGCPEDYKTCHLVFLRDWLLEKFGIQ